MVHPLKILQLQCSMHACFLQQAGTVKGCPKGFSVPKHQGWVDKWRSGEESQSLRTHWLSRRFSHRIAQATISVEGLSFWSRCSRPTYFLQLFGLLRACHMEKKRGNLRKPAEKSNSQQQPRVSIKTAVSMSSNGSELLVPFVLNRKQRDIDQYMCVCMCVCIYIRFSSPQKLPQRTLLYFSFQAVKAVQPASPQDLLCVAGRSSLTSSTIQPSPPGEICPDTLTCAHLGYTPWGTQTPTSPLSLIDTLQDMRGFSWGNWPDR